jgi:hypothetical protein
MPEVSEDSIPTDHGNKRVATPSLIQRLPGMNGTVQLPTWILLLVLVGGPGTAMTALGFSGNPDIVVKDAALDAAQDERINELEEEVEEGKSTSSELLNRFIRMEKLLIAWCVEDARSNCGID